MSNEEMWDKLFERVDSFKTTEADAKDALTLGFFALTTSFMFQAFKDPIGARKLKDSIVKNMQRSPLSRQRVDIIADTITTYCDYLDKQ